MLTVLIERIVHKNIMVAKIQFDSISCVAYGTVYSKIVAIRTLTSGAGACRERIIRIWTEIKTVSPITRIRRSAADLADQPLLV